MMLITKEQSALNEGVCTSPIESNSLSLDLLNLRGEFFFI